MHLQFFNSGEILVVTLYCEGSREVMSVSYRPKPGIGTTGTLSRSCAVPIALALGRRHLPSFPGESHPHHQEEALYIQIIAHKLLLYLKFCRIQITYTLRPIVTKKYKL